MQSYPHAHQRKYLIMSKRGEESSNHRKCVGYMLELAMLTGRTFVLPSIEDGKITDPNASLTNIDDYFTSIPREFASITMKPREFLKMYELHYNPRNSSLAPWTAVNRGDGSSVTIMNVFQQGMISATDYLRENHEVFMGSTSIIVMMERM